MMLRRLVHKMKAQTRAGLAALKTVPHKSKTEPRSAQFSRASKGLLTAARSFAQRVMELELTDAAAAALAARWRLEVDTQERKVIEWFAPAKRAAFQAHAAICRQENQALAPCREARSAINAKLAAWQAAQALPLESGDQPHQQPDSRHATQSVAAIEDGGAYRIEGVVFRETWRAEVTDKPAFLGAVAARPDLLNLVEPNHSALAHLARAHKSALDIPGVRVWREISVAASRRG
jgi:hypothetical protein